MSELLDLAALRRERDALRRWADNVCDVADDLLAPICAEAGRVLIYMPDENMTEHLPELPARLFRALYTATDRETLYDLYEHRALSDQSQAPLGDEM